MEQSIFYIALVIITIYLLVSNYLKIENRNKHLAISELKRNVLLNHATDAIFLYEWKENGMPGKFIEVNRAACDRLGYSKEELLQMTPMDLSAPEKRSEINDKVKTMLDQGKYTFECIQVRKDGKRIPVEVSNNMFDINGIKMGFSIVRDITERKEAENKIYEMAYHDSLTGLPNKHSFQEKLTDSISVAKANHHNLAVLLLEFDRFKVINDSMGHSFGDLLLQAASKRLRSILREGEIAARFGWDEFAILLPTIISNDEVINRVETIINAFTKPLVIHHNIELRIPTSIGVCIFPVGKDAESLLRYAGIAMYSAKRNGRYRYEIYSASSNQENLQKMELESSLHKALERKEFVVHYQPQISIETGKVIGVEALVRWLHPEKGLLSPGTFVPLAEETGLIIPIGEYVLKTACQQMKLWIDQGHSEMHVSVNLSVKQFQQHNLVDKIIDTLEETGLDPRHLELEITESVTMNNIDQVICKLTELRKRGIKIALDDFGTGYSSLSYLQQFPVDRIKMDKSFIRNVRCGHTEDSAIASTIISMAQNLKLKVIAEGVEVLDQLHFLRKKQCDEVQGFYFSKPLNAREFEQVLYQIEEHAAKSLSMESISVNVN